MTAAKRIPLGELRRHMDGTGCKLTARAQREFGDDVDVIATITIVVLADGDDRHAVTSIAGDPGAGFAAIGDVLYRALSQEA